MDQEQENYEYSGRAAPQAVEAEVFFLGGVMRDPNVLSDVVSLLDPDDFSRNVTRLFGKRFRGFPSSTRRSTW